MIDGPFWKPLSLLTNGLMRQVRNKEYKLALRTFYRAMKIPLNISGHMKLLGVLTSPCVAGLTSRHPPLVYKYLGTYLARGFRRKTRLAIQLNHYRYLSERISEHFLVHLADHGVRLWEDSIDGLEFSTTLAIPLTNDNEGDLSLFFEINAEKIYQISFTIAPGQPLQVGHAQVLLVGRVQGVGGKYDLIRQAGKSCHGILPGRLLLYAAEAIAEALDIHAVIGLGNEEQIIKEWSADAGVVFDYDQFWHSFNGEKTSGNLFVLPIPFPEKPIKEIKSSRRAQALRKRIFRKQVLDQVRSRFKEESVKERDLRHALPLPQIKSSISSI